MSGKKGKAKAKDDVEPSPSELEVYNRNLKRMKADYSTGNWNVRMLSSLLEETLAVRRWWINAQMPAVAEVLELYPCLFEPQFVSNVMTDSLVNKLVNRFVRNIC